MAFRASSGTNRRLKWAAILALACAFEAQGTVCHAQADKVDARALAGEGAKAYQEGRWADAIDLFTRAESLIHAPPHLLYIARAQKQTGLLVQARENLLAIVREELAPSAPHAFHQAQEDARSELKDVEGRLPYVTLTLKGAGSASVTLTQDGNKIPSALVGIPRPVDPGSHTFEAAAGSLKGRVSVDVKEGEKKRVTLELTASELPPAAPPTPAPPVTTSAPASTAPPAASAEAPPPASPPPESDTGGGGGGGGGSGLLIGSLVGFGVGAVGIGVGTVFTLSAASKKSQSDDLYNNNNCAKFCSADIQSQVKDLDDQSSSAQTLGLVGFIAGGVGIATGVTLLVLRGKSDKAAENVPTLHVAVTPSSFRLGGTF